MEKLNPVSLIPKLELVQTGSPELCKKHGKELSWKMKAFKEVYFCRDCEEEKRRNLEIEALHDQVAKEIVRCHELLNLPARFQNCRFENYMTDTAEKKKAVEICQKFVKKILHVVHVGGMAFLGGIGTGKTHLAAAICFALTEQQKRCKITTATKIIREIRTSWKAESEKNEQEILDTYSNLDLLVIDEMGQQYGTDSEKIIISEIVNDRYEGMKPTIVIGNTTLSDLKNSIGERAVDRIIDDGFLIPFGWDSFRKIQQGE